MKPTYSTLLAAWLVSPVIPAFAATDDQASRIAACTREHDDKKRLACFDQAAIANVVQPKVSADQSFGLQGSELARSRGAESTQAPAEPKRISATITAVEKRLRGELVLTLDNGQVWVQKEASGYFPIKVGDAVTILAGTLGSFRLAVGNRTTAVTRVR